MSECRICASTDAIFLNIFQKNDVRKYDAEINTCLPIKVTTEDVISLKICHVCVHKLELCNAFVCHFLATEQQRLIGSKQNVCYLCLKDDGILGNLFDGSFNWIHQIETALGCKVHRGKKVPSKICHHCAYKLGELYDLFQSALDSESKLYMMCEKSSMKSNQPPMPSKSVGSAHKAVLSNNIKNHAEKATVRVSRRNMNPTEARNAITGGVRSNLNSNTVKAVVAKLSGSSVQTEAPQRPAIIDITVTANKNKGKDKQAEILHEIVDGRPTRKGSAVPKVQPEKKHKAATKGDKATLKPVDNINIGCWKCFRDLKDNEPCTCSVDFEGSTKSKKGAQKVDVNIPLNDITSFNKTETRTEGIVSEHNKRKRENEDLGNNNAKKVRGSDKKPLQKKRDSFPLVSHVYDIRRTKRKRTITDYNQLLNDGLLLSPKVDRGKKDVKSVQKEAIKTPASAKKTPATSSRKISQKSTDMKLENQENVPRKNILQKIKSVEASNLKEMHANSVQSKKASPKSAKTAKLSPKRKVSKEKSPQEKVSKANNMDEPLPAEKLNKYECSVCSTQFPSTVEGKLHELTHTARLMNLIMYKWADIRSSSQSTSSKQNKSTGNSENTKTGRKHNTQIEGVPKEVTKVLQDVVSMVSEDSSTKLQSVNGSNITRTRKGRIVVSKLQITKITRTARNRGRRSNADALKHDETVRSIISDFESLEEKEDGVEDSSLTMIVDNSGVPDVNAVEVGCARKESSEEDLEQNNDGPNITSDVQVDGVDRSTDLVLESQERGQKHESPSSNTSPAEQGSQENQQYKTCELGSSQSETDACGDDQVGSKESDRVTEGDEVVLQENGGTDIGNACKGDGGGETADTVAVQTGKMSHVQIEDVIDIEKAPGSSGGSSVIVEETPQSTGTNTHFTGLGGSSYDLHTSIEKEIYELHGVENVEMTPPKSSGCVDSVMSDEHSTSDKVSPVNNETDLIQILE